MDKVKGVPRNIDKVFVVTSLEKTPSTIISVIIDNNVNNKKAILAITKTPHTGGISTLLPQP